MCGFVGILSPSGAVVDPRVLASMVDAQKHRGPDDRGMTFFDLSDPASGFGTAGGGAIGFRRLSIQDLSLAGHQPMVCPRGKTALVFNGEIYNAPELRSQLQRAGFRFRGHSDTEVILHLYGLRGDDFLEPLNGMFAMALVDLDRQRVLLARDRLGIKPLYFTRAGEALLFGSEIKSFLQHPAFDAQIDPEGVEEYVQFRYCAWDRTLFRGVQQVPPGHVLTVAADGALRERAYWRLPPGTTRTPPAREAAALLEDELETSVRRQLLADVEVGCQLSGGVDSSLVNLFAARHARAGMQAFSVTLADPRFSEAPWIGQAAERSGVQSNCYQLDAEEFVGELDSASWHLDQPINHPNSLGLFVLSRHASRQVKVLLSGEGADEVLAGYPRFFHARLRLLLRPLLPALALAAGTGGSVQRRLAPAENDGARFWIQASGRLSQPQAEQLLDRPLSGQALNRRLALFGESGGVDFLTQCMNYETGTYLVDLLMRQDRMTMAHSVENRVPFLDHRLLECIRGQFSSRTLLGGSGGAAMGASHSTKRPLKLISEKYFGRSFTYRPKSGFAIPLAEFFRYPAMAQRMEEELLPGIARRGVFQVAPVQRVWQNLERASPRDLDVLWSMVAFELWGRAFLGSHA
jgi:asparagine synthase (glutamine-hydrolysing)